MSSPNIFSLSGQSLKLDKASDIEPHLKPLIASDSTTEIHLGGNTLGAPACEALGSVLKGKTTLETAKLDDIFTSRLLSEIPPALSSLLTSLLSLPNLHTVDLSDNAFGLNTQAPLVDFLSRHIPLKHLILQNNGLGPAAGTLIANALTTLAERKAEARRDGKEVPDLETVICGRNRLESGSTAAWTKAFQAHTKLRTVKMVQNGIRQDGMSLLLREGLSKCEALETLDLQDNTFTHTGATALSEVISNWKSLRELGVGDSLLGSQGVKELAEVLSKGSNEQLQTLRLQYNEIDLKGVQALLKAAKNGLPALRRLELNGNKFSEDDEAVEDFRVLLQERREEAGASAAGDEWGLDELDELEEESEEEEEDEGEAEAEEGKEDSEGEAVGKVGEGRGKGVEEKEEEEEKEGRREAILKDADEEEGRKVSQKEDREVDELAGMLGKTGI